MENQEDDPNDIYLSMEINFGKQNNYFNRMEQSLEERHLENLSSLNVFASSLKDTIST